MDADLVKRVYKTHQIGIHSGLISRDGSASHLSIMANKTKAKVVKDHLTTLEYDIRETKEVIQ